MEPEESQEAQFMPTLEQQITEEQDEDVEEAPESFDWQASEFVFHEKPAIWYMGLLGLAVALEAALLVLKEWMGAAVVAVMALAVVVWSKRTPRTLNYRLDDEGVHIENKSFPYSQFRSFSAQKEVAWHAIDLEPSKRLMPRLTLICETDDFETIESILFNHLPRHDRSPDFIERITRAIKF